MAVIKAKRRRIYNEGKMEMYMAPPIRHATRQLARRRNYKQLCENISD